MLAIELTELGTPHKVCRCVEIKPPSAPGPDEFTLDILACPINFISQKDQSCIRQMLTGTQLPPAPVSSDYPHQRCLAGFQPQRNQ